MVYEQGESSNSNSGMSEQFDSTSRVEATDEAQYGTMEYQSDGGSIYWIPKVPDEVKPNKETMYESLDKAYEMYQIYAAESGFDVRKTTTKRKKGFVTTKYFVCNKEGVPNTSDIDTMDPKKSKIKRRTDMHRAGCKARVILKVVAGTGFYKIDTFEEKHNHRLVCRDNMHLLRSKRRLGFQQQNFIQKMSNQNVGATKAHRFYTGIQGGYNNCGGITTDFKNFMRDLNCFIGGNDSQMIVDKMNNRKNHVTNFSFDYQIDGRRLSSMFWADETSKILYKEFGDVVSFDATYRTNRYDMVFVPFTGIDNHKRCVTFGAGLLSREDSDSFIWLLNAFMKAFGKEPVLVLSDQCPAMKKAIAHVLPHSNHRLCMWHITSKLPIKICHNIVNNTNFKRRFHNLIWNSKIEESDFEEGWKRLIEEYNLTDNKWLSDMYDLRNSWIPAFFKHIPLAGLMRTTSRSESENHSFQKSIHCGSTLVNFMISFESCMERQRQHQNELDFKTSEKYPKMMTPLPIELNAAKLYTRKVFLQVQHEIYHSLMSCTQKNMSIDCDADVCVVREIKLDIYDNDVNNVKKMGKDDADNEYEWDNLLRETEFTVRYNKKEVTFDCTCLYFESFGTLCRHIFCVMKYYSYNEIPAKYVLRRWTKDLIPIEMLRKTFRYGDMTGNVDKIAIELFSIVEHCLTALSHDKEKLEKYLEDQKQMKISVDRGHPSSTYANKNVDFERLLGVTTPLVVDVENPAGIRNKGCGTRKRMKSRKETMLESIKKDPRTCHECWKPALHDARNCPDKKASSKNGETKN